MNDNGWGLYKVAKDEHQKAVAALAEVSTDVLWAGKGERARLVAAVVASHGALDLAREAHLNSSGRNGGVA